MCLCFNGIIFFGLHLFQSTLDLALYRIRKMEILLGVMSVNYLRCFSRIVLFLAIVFLTLIDVSGKAQPVNKSSTNPKNTEVSLIDEKNISAPHIRVGEKLTYSVKLGWISIGKRVDYVVEKMPFNGHQVYKIRSEAKTSALARVYSFQNLQYTYLNADGLNPLHFRNQLKDRKYTARVGIDFSEDEAEYQKISQLNAKSKERIKKETLEIPTGTQDELSMIYLLRRKQLVPGTTYFFPLISKGKVLKVRLHVKRGEVLKVKGLGRIRTLVVETSEGSRLWLTDDSRHIPVKIEAEMKIGKVRASLSNIEHIR